jgi:hypothetical protein
MSDMGFLFINRAYSLLRLPVKESQRCFISEVSSYIYELYPGDPGLVTFLPDAMVHSVPNLSATKNSISRGPVRGGKSTAYKPQSL